jgi:hypothetical protein
MSLNTAVYAYLATMGLGYSLESSLKVLIFKEVVPWPKIVMGPIYFLPPLLMFVFRKVSR